MARQRSFQLLVSVLASVFVCSGCTYTSDAFGPIVCQTEGERDGDRECRGGIWVTLEEIAPMEMGVDADMDMGIDVMEMNPPVDMSDMDEPVDMPPVDMCQPETQAELCENRCQTFTVLDSCGASQTIECGECGDGAPCDPETNTCLDCDPFDREAYCTENGFDCGVHDPPDGSCQTETFTCGDFNGNCQGTDTCNPDTRVCDPCEPESDAEVCLGLELFCIQPLVPTVDTCSGQGRMVDCSSCPYTPNAAPDVELGMGPFVNPEPRNNSALGADSASLVYWLVPDVGFDDANGGWLNRVSGNAPQQATFQGTVSLSPLEERANSYRLVRLGEDGFIELPLENDVGDFTFAIVFRTDFVPTPTIAAPWYEQATLFGYDAQGTNIPEFGIAMLQTGEIIYAPEVMNDGVAFSGMSPTNDGELHVLVVSRDEANDTISMMLDGVKIADEVSARGGPITAPLSVRLGAQVDAMMTMMLRGGWAGEVGDVIYYSKKSSDSLLLTLSTTLALKYGLTFDVPLEYKIDQTRVAFDATVGDGFSTHIAAIIRNDSSGLHQGRSMSSEPGAVLTLTNENTLEEFIGLRKNPTTFAIASNNQPVQTPGTVFSIDDTYEVSSIARAWRLDGANIGNHIINVSFDPSEMPGVDTLVLSDTADFSGNLAFYQVREIRKSLEDGSEVVVARAVALNLDAATDGPDPRKYFTFGELGVE